MRLTGYRFDFNDSIGQEGVKPLQLNTPEYKAFEMHWQRYALDTMGEETEPFVPEIRPLTERKKKKKVLDINLYGEPIITESDIPKETSTESLDEIKSLVRSYIHAHWCRSHLI